MFPLAEVPFEFLEKKLIEEFDENDTNGFWKVNWNRTNCKPGY